MKKSWVDSVPATDVLETVDDDEALLAGDLFWKKMQKEIINNKITFHPVNEKFHRARYILIKFKNIIKCSLNHELLNRWTDIFILPRPI